MILDEITVHNFGVFCGRHQMSLAPLPDGKPVILIGGLNGNGKTTLLRAVELALYGPLARSHRESGVSYEDYLQRWINSSVQPTEGAAVEVAFRTTVDGEPRSYRIRRSWWVKRGRVAEKLDVLVNDVANRVLAETWREHVESLIPARLSHLFFFDGERIETLADPEESSELLRTAVHALLGVDLVDQLDVDLRVLERRKRKETKEGPARQEIDDLERQVAELEEQRQELVQQCGKLQGDCEFAAKECKKAESRFGEAGGELLKGRQELEQRRAELEGNRQVVEAQLVEVATGALTLQIVQDLLNGVLGQARIEEEVAREKVLAAELAKRDASLLEALREGDAPKSAIRLVDGFLKRDRRKRSKAVSVDCYLGLSRNGLLRCEALLGGQLSDEQDKAKRLLKHAGRLVTEFDDTERRLETVPDKEALAALVADLDQARKRLSECELELAKANQQRKELESRKTAMLTRLESLLRADRETELDNKDIVHFLKHSERVRETLGRFRSALVGRSLSQLEDLILQGFTQLLRKKSLISGLSIDPESFALALHNGGGSPLLADRLSAGERQLLAVSMLWGLARASGRTLPVIIDTPLGRMDSAHRIHLVERYFPLASHQVVLLSTDEEINEVFFSKIKPRVGRTYRLEYSDESASSSISKGYFW